MARTSAASDASSSSSLPDFAGAIIDSGRLLLNNLLGTGGYGKVYQGLDLYSNKHYAVKCMHAVAPGTRPHSFQQRELEAHMLVSRHPNIVTLHKIIYEASYVFVVLQLVSGGDLFSTLTGTRLYYRNDGLIRSHFIQLLDATEYCHMNKVYHRDLKPENVLCSSIGDEVYLTDFGLCTRQEASSEFSCGSASYMSPDCLLDSSGTGVSPKPYLTAENDVWSLGVVLTNMISERNPWCKACPEDKCFAAFLRDPNYLKEVLPISAAANDILQRIFVKAADRISLKELRSVVENVETFFLTPAELARATDALKAVDEDYGDAPQASRTSHHLNGLFVSLDIKSSEGRSSAYDSSLSASWFSSDSDSGASIAIGSRDSRDSTLPVTPEPLPDFPSLRIPDVGECDGVTPASYSSDMRNSASDMFLCPKMIPQVPPYTSMLHASS